MQFTGISTVCQMHSIFRHDCVNLKSWVLIINCLMPTKPEVSFEAKRTLSAYPRLEIRIQDQTMTRVCWTTCPRCSIPSISPFMTP